MALLLPGIIVRPWLQTVGALLGLSMMCAACEPETALDHQTLEVTHGTEDDGDPGVVALRRGGAVVCTGTLISARVVVTAGHCVVPRKPDSVVFGAAPG